MTSRTAGAWRRVRWFIAILMGALVCASACTKGPEGPRCGDGVLDPGEVCDDGNAVSGDGCREDCLGAEECGDGLLDSCEECDEGEETAECDADCTFSECGDGTFNSLSESCVIVDVSAFGGEGCDCPCVDCCGNGRIDVRISPLEECDDGVATARCDGDCTLAECGDGYENPAAGEECDWGAGLQCGAMVREGTEGNRDDLPDACRSDCRRPYCGDGVVDTGAFPGGDVAAEECDGGGLETAGCDLDCTRPRCGDGVVNEAAGEDCDGGGVETADCDADCTAVICGDGVVNEAAGEDCEQDSDCGLSFFCDLEPGREGCTCVL